MVPGGSGPFLVAGAATLLIAGFAGISQTDLKRTIAFSTCSQVGYMVLGRGNGSSSAALLLLITHALYKALLFMSAGAVIHSSGDTQDIRLLGAGGFSLPISKELFTCASLSLCAFPCSAGDFSKDLILEELGYSFLSLHHGFWLCGLCGTFLTGAYSGRLLRIVFAADSRSVSPTSQHEPVSVVLILLLVLGAASTVSGMLAAEAAALAPSNPNEAGYIFGVEQTSSAFTSLLPFMLALLGGAFGIYLPSPPSHLTSAMYSLSFNQAQ